MNQGACKENTMCDHGWENLRKNNEIKGKTDTISKEKMSKPHICFIPNDVQIEASKCESHCSSDPDCFSLVERFQHYMAGTV